MAHCTYFDKSLSCDGCPSCDPEWADEDPDDAYWKFQCGSEPVEDDTVSLVSLAGISLDDSGSPEIAVDW